VKLEDILYQINKNNSRYFYNNLKLSKDYRCKKIIIDLIFGCNIFLAIGKHVDKIGKIILKTERSQSLVIVGQYLYLKNKIEKKLKSLLIYPLILFFISIFSISIISVILNIKFYEIIIVPLCIYSISFYYFKIIINKFNYIIKMKIVLEFLKNQISFKDLKKIFLIYGHKIPNKEFNDFYEVIQTLLFISVYNFDQFKDLYEEEVKSFDKFAENNVMNSLKFNLVFLGFYIIYFILKSINIIIK
jgi:hypothetical protein